MSKPIVGKGVPSIVNAPADQTNGNIQTNNTINKLYPIDFTYNIRKPKTFKIISRVRDIMNAIDGPKTLSLNMANSNDINIINTRDNVSLFGSSFVNATDDPKRNFIVQLASNVTLTLKENPQLYVRRDGENANAVTAYNADVATYADQAARVTSNAPNDSLYSYPFIFSNYTLDPALRPLCIAPILKHFYTKYSAPSSPPTVSVLKLSTLNSNINTKTLFPGSSSIFPHNAVVIDCSNLTTSNIGKLYKLSPYIIDVSNTHQGSFNALSTNEDDSDIAAALDCTYTSQDIEFAIWLGSIPYSMDNYAATINFLLDTYKYDPVEAVFSYFSTRKYENYDHTLFNMSVNSVYNRNMWVSNRLSVTYLIQQAGKQMHAWCTPSRLLTNGTYLTSDFDNYLHFNNTIQHALSVSSNYPLWPKWIPYEYVKASNESISLDKVVWTSGRGNRKCAKHVLRPASFAQTTNLTIPYYNKFGEVVTLNFGSYNMPVCVPISIYCENLPDRSVYTTQLWNENNMLSFDYLEESDYFPERNLEATV